MVSQMLSARSYSHLIILATNMENNPSFIWHSLLSTQDLLKVGCRQRVGIGEDIDVWASRWVSITHSFRINWSTRVGCLMEFLPKLINLELKA